jgi:NAD+ kinase
MKSLGIFAAPGKPQAHELAERLAEMARKRGLDVHLQIETESVAGGDGCPISDELASCDVLATFSGDGGVLTAARAAAKFNTPVLAFDLGRLGFLATASPGDLESTFQRLLAGDFRIQERMMLDATVLRLKRGTAGPEPEYEEVGGGVVLNDAVVAKSALARILRLSIYARGELIGQLRADGLVVSTPTGSTAYALSAGGPIVSPDVPLLLVCPICAHTLTQRPFVVGPEEVLEIHAEWEGDEVQPSALDAMLTLDGQVGVSLKPKDIVRVRRANCTARLLRAPGDSFYARLRLKMGWGG